jgi:hypothetical protein
MFQVMEGDEMSVFECYNQECKESEGYSYGDYSDYSDEGDYSEDESSDSDEATAVGPTYWADKAF